MSERALGGRTAAARVVLAERGTGDYAVAFAADAFVIEGVPLRAGRRVAVRAVDGIERAGAWLWIGAGLVPALCGGSDVGSERLARAEAELRARIAALPDGAARLARIDARLPQHAARPWGTLALATALPFLGLGGLASPVLLLAMSALAEPWLGALRLAVCGAAGLGAAHALGVGSEAALAASLAWGGLFTAARLRRRSLLSVRTRCALDVALAVSLAAAALGFAGGASAVPLVAALSAGAAVAPILLHGWPRPDTGQPRAPRRRRAQRARARLGLARGERRPGPG